VTGPTLPRRTALVAGAGTVLAVAGCDGGSGTPGAGSSGATGSAGTAAPSASPSAANPDEALVRRVVAALQHAERVATGRGSLELAALHRAHLAALDAPVPSGRGPRHGPPVRRTEQHLHATLVAAAASAASGTLARLLASMSAAVAQRLAMKETVA
jgi:hypothetical protein